MDMEPKRQADLTGAGMHRRQQMDARILATMFLLASTIAAPAATFVRDGNRLVLTGQIRSGDATAFAHLAASLPDDGVVVLGSDGGSLPDSLAIGRLVRERH